MNFYSKGDFKIEESWGAKNPNRQEKLAQETVKENQLAKIINH